MSIEADKPTAHFFKHGRCTDRAHVTPLPGGQSLRTAEPRPKRELRGHPALQVAQVLQREFSGGQIPRLLKGSLRHTKLVD
jgi:hypothetical protein